MQKMWYNYICPLEILLYGGLREEMGALNSAMKKFGQEWSADKNLTPDRMKKWFGRKVATPRSLEAMSFTKKSAVVLVGVSGIGKTTFMKKLVNQFPGFNMICYDECYNEAMNDMKRHDESTELRMIELVERKLRKYQNGNIIIDGKFLHPATRAALYEVLNKVYGYEVHVVYFSMSYIEENFPVCAYKRAIQFSLYGEYLKGLTDAEKKNADFIKLDEIRENIMETTAAKRGVSVDTIFREYAETEDVERRVQEYVNNLMSEIESYAMQIQYMCQYFHFGADYFYEL